MAADLGPPEFSDVLKAWGADLIIRDHRHELADNGSHQDLRGVGHEVGGGGHRRGRYQSGGS
eukprot:3935259-Pyramimonas_sp.AAC.1